MNKQTDSKALFVKQVDNHSQILCDLLGCDTTAPVPVDIMERCVISTRLLAGTSDLMGLAAWTRFLSVYERLLLRYNERRFFWDERVAGVTSESIEKEESLAKAFQVDPSCDFDLVVHPDELDALSEEIAAMKESDPPVGPVEEASGAVGEAPEEKPELSKGADAPVASAAAQTAAEAVRSSGVPLAGIITELKRVSVELSGRLESDSFCSRRWSSPEIEDLRSFLYFVDFYIRSIDEAITLNADSPLRLSPCDLVPLDVALKDFAFELSSSGEHELDIDLVGENIKVDPRVLLPAGAALRWLITDVFHRSEVSPVRISVKVSESMGALHWQLSDNGGNYISDSRLDHEDQLAFYPGLKKVRKLLGKSHGVLCVEPHHNGEVRFEFSLPREETPESFMVWGENANMFGVRSVQLCDLFPVADAPRGVDSFGEFLTIDNKRVPLIKLDLLFSEAPSSGELIAVIGSLEKRVGFYVPDSGALATGKTLERSIPVWQGHAHPVAEVNEKRIALMDADQVLAGYMDLTSEMDAGDVSGGVLDDDSQATSVTDAQAPPDRIEQEGDDGAVEVLIVEQSDSLKDALNDILTRQRYRATFASSLDEALDLIRTQTPQLIISEFRMPSMAAKVLVDTLAKEDRPIPVLVTTSQSGSTADLLVEKLGAAGYLSKPLDLNDVSNRINSFLNNPTSVV